MRCVWGLVIMEWAFPNNEEHPRFSCPQHHPVQVSSQCWIELNGWTTAFEAAIADGFVLVRQRVLEAVFTAATTDDQTAESAMMLPVK